MIKSILEAVADSLYSEFGDRYKIYSDPLPQGTEEPCFYVLLLNSTVKRVMDKRYYMTNQVCIQYLPFDKINPKTEFAEVIQRLMTTVDDITVDNKPIHGSSIHTESTDEVLNFFINYNLSVYRERNTANTMTNIEITQAIRGSKNE